jgi:hypothetical protein
MGARPEAEWKRHASIVGHAEIYVHDWTQRR